MKLAIERDVDLRVIDLLEENLEDNVYTKGPFYIKKAMKILRRISLLSYYGLREDKSLSFRSSSINFQLGL